MNFMKNAIARLSLCMLACPIALPVVAAGPVSGSDRRLVYTGRIDLSNGAAPAMSWPGSSVAGNFSGPLLSVTLDDQFGSNYFNVFIDGDLERPRIIQAQRGTKKYVLAQDIGPGRHSFLLTKRTEGEDGATTFRNFELAPGETFLEPPSRPDRRIEFFGDSITSGMGNEAADDGPDNLPRDKNNFMAYDAIVARSLGAELHVTSQSGIGVMVSWFPFTMPEFYAQLNAVGKNDSRWDFSRWTPQVVVINLFQNDKWLIENEHRLSPVPTDEQRIQAYVDFVTRIRKAYPDARIICALGSMDAMQAGSKWPGYVRAAVARLSGDGTDKKIDTIFFDFTGYAAHPRVRQHQAMAAKLTAFIKSRMQW